MILEYLNSTFKCDMYVMVRKTASTQTAVFLDLGTIKFDLHLLFEKKTRKVISKGFCVVSGRSVGKFSGSL